MRGTARSATAAFVLAAFATQGCVGFRVKTGDKVPKAPPVDASTEAPTVAIRFTADPAGWHPKVLDKARERYPMLARARVEYPGPEEGTPTGDVAEYTATVSVTVTEKEIGNPEVTGYTFGLWPYAYNKDVRYDVELVSREGETIAIRSATIKTRMYVQLLLVWAMPLDLFLLANVHGERRLLRRVLGQVEADIRADMATRRAAPASSACLASTRTAD